MENETVEITLGNSSNHVNLQVELFRVEDSEIIGQLAGFAVSTADSKPFPDKLMKLSILFSPDKTSISTFNQEDDLYEPNASGRGWGSLISSAAPNPQYSGVRSLSYNSNKIIKSDVKNSPIILKEFTLRDRVVYQLRLSISERDKEQQKANKSEEPTPNLPSE